MYTELIVRPIPMADQSIYPDVARKLVAEAMDGKAVSPLLFNRDEHGKCISTRFDRDVPGDIASGLGMPPAVIFDGGKGFIRIYGIGAPGKEVLDGSAAEISLAIGQHVGGAFKVDINHGECGIKIQGPRLYSIRRLVVAKGGKDKGNFAKFIDVDPRDVHDDVATAIYRGILSQAKWLDANAGPDGEKARSLASFVPDIDTLGIDIVSGKSVPVPTNGRGLAAAFSNLVFSMNMTLVGPWYAGHLRSRGYGGIRPYIHRRQS